MGEIQANLDTSRMSPERLEELMGRLYVLMDSEDGRVGEKAIKQVIDLYKWQTEYEAPKAQKVEHEFPTAIEICVVSDTRADDGHRVLRVKKGE
jgi:hypothetical protein